MTEFARSGRRVTSSLWFIGIVAFFFGVLAGIALDRTVLVSTLPSGIGIPKTASARQLLIGRWLSYEGGSCEFHLDHTVDIFREKYGRVEFDDTVEYKWVKDDTIRLNYGHGHDPKVLRVKASSDRLVLVEEGGDMISFKRSDAGYTHVDSEEASVGKRSQSQ